MISRVIGKCYYCKGNVGYYQNYCHVYGMNLAHVGCRRERGEVMKE